MKCPRSSTLIIQSQNTHQKFFYAHLYLLLITGAYDISVGRRYKWTLLADVGPVTRTLSWTPMFLLLLGVGEASLRPVKESDFEEWGWPPQRPTKPSDQGRESRRFTLVLLGQERGN